jgi:hypothetical protein
MPTSDRLGVKEKHAGNLFVGLSAVQEQQSVSATRHAPDHRLVLHESDELGALLFGEEAALSHVLNQISAGQKSKRYAAFPQRSKIKIFGPRILPAKSSSVANFRKPENPISQVIDFTVHDFLISPEIATLRHVWTPASAQEKSSGSLWRVVGC